MNEHNVLKSMINLKKKNFVYFFGYIYKPKECIVVNKVIPNVSYRETQIFSMFIYT